MTGFWYIATPYSKYPDGLDAAHDLAVEVRDLLIASGVRCFSPVAFCHETAKTLGLNPHDHDIWLPVCAPIMAHAKGLIMVRAVSWANSHGMGVEFKMFVASGRPVVYVDPGIVPKNLT